MFVCDSLLCLVARNSSQPSLLKLFHLFWQILSTDEDPNWYKAEKDGKEGLIPKNYVNIKTVE